MSFQPHFPDLLDTAQGVVPVQPDLPLPTPLPATEKQLTYARILAAKSKSPLPKGLEKDRIGLSKWIDGHKAPKPEGKFADYPSSKQVAFAERIARLKRREVPHECFRDRVLMSRWIDSNKPR